MGRIIYTIYDKDLIFFIDLNLFLMFLFIWFSISCFHSYSIFILYLLQHLLRQSNEIKYFWIRNLFHSILDILFLALNISLITITQINKIVKVINYELYANQCLDQGRKIDLNLQWILHFIQKTHFHQILMCIDVIIMKFC